VMEFVIDEKVARAAVPDCVDVPDCMDRLGLDAIGCGSKFVRVQESDDGTYVDEWGVLYQVGGVEVVDHPVRGPIQTKADAEAYTPPDPGVSHRLGLLPDVVTRYKGRRAILFFHRAAFMWSAYVCGLDNLLADFVLDPEKAELVMDKVLEANMAVVRNAIHAGAEIIALGDDYAHNFGPLMSPEMFERFILPRDKRMIDMIHEEGALCLKHTDGNLYPILDMLVASGPDCLNPFEPVAGMELKRVKELIGDKVCLAGNIDCGQLLPHGTVDDVREAVRRAIDDAAEGGGFILTSSNSIHSTCKPENYIAMVEACKEFGVYA